MRVWIKAEDGGAFEGDLNDWSDCFFMTSGNIPDAIRAVVDFCIANEWKVEITVES